MRAFVRLATVLALATALGLAGCDDDPPPAEPTPEDNCMTYAQGISVTTDTGGYTVAIIDSAMTPPDRGINTFVMTVADGDGNLVDSGISLVLEPFMPQHGHGSTPAEVTAVAKGSGGEYDAGDINLFMPGAWEVRLEVTPDGATEGHKGVFTFCVDG